MAKKNQTCIYLATLVLCGMTNVALGRVHTNCTFPEIMDLENDHALDHTWRFLSPDPTYKKEHSTGQWSFHMHSVYISHGMNLNDYDSADGYDYECIENVGEDKVIAKRIDINDAQKDGKFTCLQFISRSPAVIQMRMAEYSDTADSSLCNEENLKSDDTTLVHFHSAMWYKVLEQIPYMTCGIEGGYLIEQWYDQDGKPGCTADVKNSLRIEDECDKGSGLQISGESDSCPSPLDGLDVYKNPLTCIAKWEDKTYSYSVATDEWNSFFVCLRVPIVKRQQYDMHLFLDGICDSTDSIKHSKKYRKLRMNQFVVSDLCADASPRCPLLSKEECIGDVPNMCRKTCGVCPDGKTWLESKLPEEIQGDWFMQTTDKPGDKITITDRAVKFPEMGSWRFFNKSTCERSRVGHQKKATEYVFISYSINGCLPRVATAMVNLFSPSVIGVQFSQSGPSILGKVNKTSVWDESMKAMCELTRYSQDAERLRDKYHTAAYGWQNLVQVAQYPSLSQCKLNKKEEFSLVLNSGATCEGELTQRKLGDAFDMVLNDCGEDNDTIHVPGGLSKKVRYECMARFSGAQEWDTYIITRTPGQTRNVVNETFVCWYLPKGRAGYLMPISSCDDMTDAEIFLDEKKPLARLHLARSNKVANSAIVSAVQSNVIRICILPLLYSFMLWCM